MQRYIILRLGQAVLALLVISIVVFALARVTGSPLDVLLPEEATAVDIARVEARWGLDSPLHIQAGPSGDHCRLPPRRIEVLPRQHRVPRRDGILLEAGVQSARG